MSGVEEATQQPSNRSGGGKDSKEPSTPVEIQPKLPLFGDASPITPKVYINRRSLTPTAKTICHQGAPTQPARALTATPLPVSEPSQQDRSDQGTSLNLFRGNNLEHVPDSDGSGYSTESASGESFQRRSVSPWLSGVDGADPPSEDYPQGQQPQQDNIINSFQRSAQYPQQNYPVPVTQLIPQGAYMYHPMTRGPNYPGPYMLPPQATHSAPYPVGTMIYGAGGIPYYAPLPPVPYEYHQFRPQDNPYSGGSLAGLPYQEPSNHHNQPPLTQALQQPSEAYHQPQQGQAQEQPSSTNNPGVPVLDPETRIQQAIEVLVQRYLAEFHSMSPLGELMIRRLVDMDLEPERQSFETLLARGLNDEGVAKWAEMRMRSG